MSDNPHQHTRECLLANEPRDYTLDYALHIARLWRAEKLIGVDKDAVIAALLTEVERLQSTQNPAPEGIKSSRRAFRLLITGLILIIVIMLVWW